MAAVVVANEAASASVSASGAKDHTLDEVSTLKKGPWTSAEDAILVEYVKKHGEGNWNAVQKHSGLYRCGKSCRLRWANHLRPNLKKGAFTPEEEHIIMELHANLGNKWARMAAQLPGRTDNEIKNYWNTRIKRRQRAGLPLYPPDIQPRDPNQQTQQPPNGDTLYDRVPPHDQLLLNSKPEISTDSFDRLKPTNMNCPPFSGLTDVSMNSMLNQAYGMGNPIQRLKRIRDNQCGSFFTGPTSSPCGQMVDDGRKNMQPCFRPKQTYSQTARWDAVAQGFPYDPDPINKILPPFGGALTGSHALINGTFSASRPFPDLKLELPSSQFAESVNTTGTGTPVLNMNSPLTLSSLPYHLLNKADACFSPSNSGLLESLLQEAHTMGGIKPPSELPAVSSGSNNNPMNDVFTSQRKFGWGENSDPTTPLDGRAASVFSESTPPLSNGPWDESSLHQSPNGMNMNSEEPSDEYISSRNSGDEDISTLLGFTRPDESPVTDWYNHNAEIGKEQSVVTGALATVFNDDFGIDIQQLSSITSPSSQAWGLGSCPWNNMPGVC